MDLDARRILLRSAVETANAFLKVRNIEETLPTDESGIAILVSAFVHNKSKP